MIKLNKWSKEWVIWIFEGSLLKPRKLQIYINVLCRKNDTLATFLKLIFIFLFLRKRKGSGDSHEFEEMARCQILNVYYVTTLEVSFFFLNVMEATRRFENDVIFYLCVRNRKWGLKLSWDSIGRILNIKVNTETIVYSLIWLSAEIW